MSTSFSSAAHLVSWKRPFPTDWWHLTASHGSIGISSSAYGRLQKALQLSSWLINHSTALRLREFTYTRASMHSTALLVINAGWVCAGSLLQSASSLVFLSSRSCQSSWARALLSTSCHFFSCSGARRTRTVRLLDELILARGLTSPQPPIGSYLPCIPEFSGGCVNFKRVRCKIHSDETFCVDCPAVAVATSTAGPSCLRKERFDPCSNMACVEYSSLVFA